MWNLLMSTSWVSFLYHNALLVSSSIQFLHFCSLTVNTFITDSNVSIFFVMRHKKCTEAEKERKKKVVCLWHSWLEVNKSSVFSVALKYAMKRTFQNHTVLRVARVLQWVTVLSQTHQISQPWPKTGLQIHTETRTTIPPSQESNMADLCITKVQQCSDQSQPFQSMFLETKKVNC